MLPNSRPATPKHVSASSGASLSEVHNCLYNIIMKTLSVSDFREQCLQLFEGLPAEGILITRRGRAVAKVTPVPSPCSDLIGRLPGVVSNPKDDLFATGVAWDAESGHAYLD